MGVLWTAMCTCGELKPAFRKSKKTCSGATSIEFRAGERLDAKGVDRLAQQKCGGAPAIKKTCPYHCDRKVTNLVSLDAPGNTDEAKTPAKKGGAEKEKTSAEKFIEDMEQKGLSKDDVCRARANLEIVEQRELPACSVADQVVGSDCSTHYTLYTTSSASADPSIAKPNERTTCQCNEGTNHSERLALEAGATRMANLAYPCQGQCYRAMIRHLASNQGAKLYLTYKTVRRTAAKEIHDGLPQACGAQ